MSHLHVSGDGPPVVLIHGVGLDHTMWDDIVPLLSDRRTIVRYDLLGHGRSADPDGPRTIDDFVSQLRDVVDELGGQPVDVVGSSLGSLIASTAAATRPRLVRTLTAANMVFGRDPLQQAAVAERLSLTEDVGMGAVADLAIDRWFPLEWQSAHPDRVRQIDHRLRTTDLTAYLKAYRMFVSTDLEGSELAGSIRCPTLVVTGRDDPGSTPAMTEAAAAAIPGATALVLDGLGHLPSVEAPQRFVNALLSFLDSEVIHA